MRPSGITAGASASTPGGVRARGSEPSAPIAQIRKPPSCPRIGTRRRARQLARSRRVEIEGGAVRGPFRRAVPVRGGRHPARTAAIAVHHVELAFALAREAEDRMPVDRRVAIGRESDLRAVGREVGAEVAARIVREIARGVEASGGVRRERNSVDVRVAARGAHERERAAVRGERGLVLQRGAVDQQTGGGRGAAPHGFDVDRVEVGVTPPFRREHHPTSVRRQHRVVVEARAVGREP